MYITNVPEVEFEPGSILIESLEQTRDLCVETRCEIKLTFNGKTHTISRFTDIEKLAKFWND